MHEREETQGTQRWVQLFIKHELKAVTMVIPYLIPSHQPFLPKHVDHNEASLLRTSLDVS